MPVLQTHFYSKQNTSIYSNETLNLFECDRFKYVIFNEDKKAMYQTLKVLRHIHYTSIVVICGNAC